MPFVGLVETIDHEMHTAGHWVCLPLCGGCWLEGWLLDWERQAILLDTDQKQQTFRIACSNKMYCANAFKMVSCIWSSTTKPCAFVPIALLVRITFSWTVPCLRKYFFQAVASIQIIWLKLISITHPSTCMLYNLASVFILIRSP
jgi:hypothetical protein